MQHTRQQALHNHIFKIHPSTHGDIAERRLSGKEGHRKPEVPVKRSTNTTVQWKCSGEWKKS